MPQVTTQELRAIFSGDATSYENALNRANRANSNFMASNKRVAKSLTEVTAQMSGSGGAFGAAEAGVMALGRAFKIGLAPLIAVDAIANAMKQYKEAGKELEKLEQELQGVMNVQSGTTSKSIETITKEVENAEAVLLKFQKEQQEYTNMDKLANNMFGKGKIPEIDQSVKVAQQEVYNLKADQAKKEEELSTIAAVRLNGTKQEADIMERQNKAKEEQAKADATHNVKYAAAVAGRLLFEERLAVVQKENADARLELETKIASLRGSSDDRRAAALQLEAEYLSSMTGKQGTDSNKTSLEAAKNQQALEDEANRQALEGIKGRGETTQLNEGSGPQAELQALRDQLKTIEEITGEKMKQGTLDATAKIEQEKLEAAKNKEIDQKESEIESAETLNSLEYEKIAIMHDGQSAAREKYELEKAEIQAINDQIASQDLLNQKEDSGLKIKRAALQADAQAAVLAAFMTPSRGPQKGMMQPSAPTTAYGAWQASQAAQNNQAKRAAIAQQLMMDNGGVWDAKKDINGNVIGGKDPITGKPVDFTDPNLANPHFDPNGPNDPTFAWRSKFKNNQDSINTAKQLQRDRVTNSKKDNQDNPVVKELVKIEQKIDDLVLR